MNAFIRRIVFALSARRPALAAIRCAIVIAAVLTLAGAPAVAAPVYATAEDALQAFRAAVDGEGGKGLLDLFGKEYEADLIGGDPAEARQTLATLRRMAAQGMTLSPEGADRMTIIMGRRGWPMPVPLVKGASGWTFDVKDGLQEITDRRVGRNELSAIALCNAFIILKEQGANPPGGKYSYVINGNMIAGFAMIAWPADYRRSGIMTFQCGHTGRIVEKDLGAETVKLVAAITTYDPDKTWVPAEGE